MSMPIAPMNAQDAGSQLEASRVEIVSRSPESTQNIGKTLGAYAQPGHVFLLIGDLGTGKTCLTQGVLWGLGSDEYARSPTFVMVSQYQGRLTLYHIDLYRVDSPDELIDLGLDEYLNGDGVCAVEWADRAPGVFPQDHIRVQIQHLGETERRLTLSTSAVQYIDMLNALESSLSKG